MTHPSHRMVAIHEAGFNRCVGCDRNDKTRPLALRHICPATEYVPGNTLEEKVEDG